MHRSVLRAARVIGAAAIALAGVVAAAAPAAATSYTVHTGGAALTERSAPYTWSTAYGSVANGDTVNVVCQRHGTSVSGTYGTSDIWDQLANGRFVSDAYVYTGADGMVMDACVKVAAPPRDNPRTVDEAISWEFSYMGSTAYEGWCDKFQAMAFGWSHSGEVSAQAHWNHLRSLGLTHTSGTPPRGALVFYQNSGDDFGHIVVSLGAGRIVGTSVGGQVGTAAYTYRGGYLGWATPDFPNGG
jgi:uncharacterized protein YraI